jgi:hypothetical protein
MNTESKKSAQADRESMLECFNELADPEECRKDLREWFLSFVSTELPDKDREAHIRHVNNYREVIRLLSSVK